MCANVPSDYQHFVDAGGNESAIECVASAGITRGGSRGMPSNRFGPELVVERDEMATFIVRLLDAKAGLARPGQSLRRVPLYEGVNVFTDLPASNPQVESVNRVARAVGSAP